MLVRVHSLGLGLGFLVADAVKDTLQVTITGPGATIGLRG